MSQQDDPGAIMAARADEDADRESSDECVGCGREATRIVYLLVPANAGLPANDAPFAFLCDDCAFLIRARDEPAPVSADEDADDSADLDDGPGGADGEQG